MTLDKAIEILEIENGSRHEPLDPDLYDAINLGLEALKRLKWYKEVRTPWEIELSPLPRETEE